MTIKQLIENRYANPFRPGIKVNLYRGYEYRALAQALRDLAQNPVESVMVGDSYFMTHLNAETTQLNPEQSQHARQVLPELIAEIRLAIDADTTLAQKPLLMADVPSGLADNEIRQILQAYKTAGADMIKLELLSLDEFWIVREIRGLGLIPAMHIGYVPQKNENKTYGTSRSEIINFQDLILQGIEAGVECVIFERLTEVSNQILTRFCLEHGVLPYSIFSGRAPLGGQSLNVWDAVVLPSRQSIFFPPTSVLPRAKVGKEYQEDLIADCMRKLIRLTVAQVFPPSPRNNIELSSYLEIIGENLT
jgi:hypothetical protein